MYDCMNTIHDDERGLKGFAENHASLGSLGLEAAIALTGLAKRTLWRRMGEGSLRKLSSSDREGGRGVGASSTSTSTRLVLEDVLKLAGLSLDREQCALLERADSGDGEAQAEMGQMLGQMQRPEAAIYWLQRATDHNHADAMQSLGRCYAAGEGVARDEHLAMMWIARAAALGHSIARLQMVQIMGVSGVSGGREERQGDASS